MSDVKHATKAPLQCPFCGRRPYKSSHFFINHLKSLHGYTDEKFSDLDNLNLSPAVVRLLAQSRDAVERHPYSTVPTFTSRLNDTSKPEHDRRPLQVLHKSFLPTVPQKTPNERVRSTTPTSPCSVGDFQMPETTGWSPGSTYGEYHSPATTSVTTPREMSVGGGTPKVDPQSYAHLEPAHDTSSYAGRSPELYYNACNSRADETSHHFAFPRPSQEEQASFTTTDSQTRPYCNEQPAQPPCVPALMLIPPTPIISAGGKEQGFQQDNYMGGFDPTLLNRRQVIRDHFYSGTDSANSSVRSQVNTTTVADGTQQFTDGCSPLPLAAAPQSHQQRQDYDQMSVDMMQRNLQRGTRIAKPYAPDSVKCQQQQTTADRSMEIPSSSPNVTYNGFPESLDVVKAYNMDHLVVQKDTNRDTVNNAPSTLTYNSPGSVANDSDTSSYVNTGCTIFPSSVPQPFPHWMSISSESDQRRSFDHSDSLKQFISSSVAAPAETTDFVHHQKTSTPMAYSVYEAHDPVLSKDNWSSQDVMLMDGQPKASADAVYATLMANIDSL